MNPLVSIVVLSHNRRDRIVQTLDSVLQQRHPNVEIVVVDDGSTDGSLEILESMGDRIRLHAQENTGVAGARTAGCRLARGELIAFQDDDDLMPPHRIVRSVEALRANPDAVLAFGQYALIDENDERTGEVYRPSMPAEGEDFVRIEDGYHAIITDAARPLPHTTVFRREAGEAAGWFDERFYRCHEDGDFLARIAVGRPIVYVPEVVSLYRVIDGSGSLSRPSTDTTYCRILYMLKHLEEVRPPRQDTRRSIERRLYDALRQLDVQMLDGSALGPRVEPAVLARAGRTIRRRARVRRRLHPLELPLRRRLGEMVSALRSMR